MFIYQLYLIRIKTSCPNIQDVLNRKKVFCISSYIFVFSKSHQICHVHTMDMMTCRTLRNIAISVGIKIDNAYFRLCFKTPEIEPQETA